MRKTTKIILVLKRLANENNGLILPEKVVEEARPTTSPLHSSFEWNNGKAAEKYRIWQARQLLRVCIEQIPQSKNPVQVFVSLRTDRKEGGYRIQTEVLGDAEMRRILLADALEELSLFRVKYSRLRELAIVFKAIRHVSKR